jgi:hypothetical protein
MTRSAEKASGRSRVKRGQIMKHRLLTILGIGTVLLAGLLLVGCEEEPTQAEANEAFCDSVGDFAGALRNMRDLDKNSTNEEFEQARDDLSESYDAMIASAAGVVEVRLDELNEARDDLQNAVDDLSGDLTLEESLDAVDDEVEAVALEVAQIYNDVDCGREPGDDIISDE